MKKVGFFGGTFDPFHFGHLNLIIELHEKYPFDRLLLCPTGMSPTKQDCPPVASAEHRLQMLKRISQDLPFIEIVEREIHSSQPSYTVKTLESLKQEGERLYLMMAEDSAYTIDQWETPEKLLELATPLVATRHGFDASRLEHFPPFIKEKLQKGAVQISAMDISSTRVRERLKKGLYCGHLIPAKILDYIYENRLYYNS